MPTVPINYYNWAMVTPSFFVNGAWNLTETGQYQFNWPGFLDGGPVPHFDEILVEMQEHFENPEFERLENHKCFAQYRQNFGTDLSDLLLVTAGRRVDPSSPRYIPIDPQFVTPNESLQSNSLVAYGYGGTDEWEVSSFLALSMKESRMSRTRETTYLSRTVI